MGYGLAPPIIFSFSKSLALAGHNCWAKSNKGKMASGGPSGGPDFKNLDKRVF
jgi:hypothetical protein